MLIKLVRWSGLWWGLGLLPKAPGTWGTLGALPLVWAMQFLAPLYGLVFAWGFTAISMLVAQVYVDHVSESSDPKEFVLDEVAGFLVTMSLVPFTWGYLLAGFALFRFLDILKPFPISYVDRKIKGGIGVVADDILAGILANVILQIWLQSGVSSQFLAVIG